MHLYKLLRGDTFDRSHIFKHFISQGTPRAGNSKKSHGFLCWEFHGWRTCWMWCLATNGCKPWTTYRVAFWFATQQTAISRCVRRTSSRRSPTATKLNAGSQLGIVQRGNGATSKLSPGNFWQGLVFPKQLSSTVTAFAGTSHSALKWHWHVSYSAAAEKAKIMLAVKDYNTLTTVRLVRRNSPPSGDYVHITGQNSGCWSYVGRIGKVSGTVQLVVKTSPALRTKLIGIRSSNPKHTNAFRFISCYQTLTPIPTSCTNPSGSLSNQLRFTNDQQRGADSWPWYLVQKISVCELKTVFGVGRWIEDCAAMSVLQHRLYWLKWLLNVHLFKYLSVQRHVIHSYSTLHCPSIKSLWWIILPTIPLSRSLPTITILSVIPFHSAVWPKNCYLHKITTLLRTLTVTLHNLILPGLTNDRKDLHVLLTSPVLWLFF
jgi:hypothetical protein